MDIKYIFKNRQVYKKVGNEWVKCFCDSPVCTKIATVVLRYNEGVVCEEHYQMAHSGAELIREARSI